VHVKNGYFFDFSVENVEKHCLVQFFELFSLQWLFKHAYEVVCDIQKLCMGRIWLGDRHLHAQHALHANVKNPTFCTFSDFHVKKHYVVQFFELFSLQTLFKHAYEVVCDFRKVCMGRIRFRDVENLKMQNSLSLVRYSPSLGTGRI